VFARFDIINHLISNNGYSKYLEIGVRDNRTFKVINAAHKDGVDPAGKCNYKMTSDDFFRQLGKSFQYDIVFIDGLHVKDQVLRDVDNSLAHLSPGGVIVLHDCSPKKPEHAIKKYKGYGVWNGTVWEAIAELRMTRTDLSMWVVDTDHGCGIIKKGSQKLYPKTEIKFELLEKDRKNLLNLISVDEFLKMGL